MKKKLLRKHLSAYSAIAGTLVGMIQPAQGAIQYTDIDPDVTYNSNGDEYELDLNNDGTIDYKITYSTFTTVGIPVKKISVDAQNQNKCLWDSGKIIELDHNVNIGTYLGPFSTWDWGEGGLLKSFTSYSYGGGGQWGGAVDKYMGLQLEVGGNIHYGWARLDVHSFADEFTIKDYAFEDIPDQSILAGATGGAVISAGAISNLSVADIGDNGDKSDLQVSFDKAADENKVDHYRVIAVKAADAGAFDVGTASALMSGWYTRVDKTGANISQSFESLDRNGDPIENDTPYKIFVLSVADGTQATMNTLSDPSDEITLKDGVIMNVADPIPLDNDIRVYRVHNTIAVDFDQPGNLPAVIKVFNAQGQMIHQNVQNQPRNRVVMRDINSGLYITVIETPKGMVTKKVYLNGGSGL